MIDKSLVAKAEMWIDQSGVADRVETLLPRGPRARVLPVRSLFVLLWLTAYTQRSGFLVGCLDVWQQLPHEDQRRLVPPEDGRPPRQITYRLIERTFGAVAHCLDPEPMATTRGDRSQRWSNFQDRPSDAVDRHRLRDEVCNALILASVPTQYRTHRAHALDWTDISTWARPRRGPQESADQTADWGVRTPTEATSEKKLPFFGYYMQAISMTREEGGLPVPELVVAMELLTPTAGQWPPKLSIDLLRRSVKREALIPGDLLAWIHR
jgi:hypothetical protein